MPIIAKNIIVGGLAPPTEVKTDAKSFSELRNVFSDTTTETVELIEEPKYIHKTDGELVRHINRKSTYLRDMLELLD